MAVFKLAVLLSGRGLDYRYGHGGMKISKGLSLRETADSTRRESAPPASGGWQRHWFLTSAFSEAECGRDGGVQEVLHPRGKIH